MKYYVYELIDPRSNLVFYVGKGKGNRLEQHFKEAISGKQSPKCQVIREIWGDGYEPIRHIVQHFTDEMQAYEFEAQRIELYGLANLTNQVPGGFGGESGASVTEDAALIYYLAKIARRSKSFTEKLYYSIGNHSIDLQEAFYPQAIKMIRDIIRRRGVEWANKIVKARKMNMEFSPDWNDGCEKA